jgi:hypothetical protein
MASENDTLYDRGRSKDAPEYLKAMEWVEFLIQFDDNHSV